MTWDGSKEGRVLDNKKGKRKKRLKKNLWKFLEKNRRVGSTCGRKPQTWFGYNTNFKCCFGILKRRRRLCCNLDSCFSNTEAQTSTMNSMFIFCVNVL